ncbi:MAG: MBL fold metallo-hydrolase [Phycisphaerales bacterium]|nr:MBL fold metallo-hydrolase [Phycisphaerales bacterium]
MELLVTGIGDAFTAASFGSSGLIASSEGLVAIDCPGAVLHMYRDATEASGWTVDPTDVSDILLTHLHGDHSDGLETMGFLNRYVRDPARRPRLHALPEVLDRVWEKLAPAMDGSTRAVANSRSTLEDYFEPCPITPESPATIGELTVHVRRTVHSLPCMALRITNGTATLGWSSDTEFVPELVAWLSEADVIVHECGEHFKHTSLQDLQTLPDTLQKKIRLIHMPDGFEVPEGLMRPLRQGEVVVVQPPA